MMLFFNMHGYGFIQPDLERASSSDLGSVLVVMIFVHLDPHHIFISWVCCLRERHYPVCGNRGISHIFHASKIRVLHPDFSVYRARVPVPRTNGAVKLGKPVPDLFKLIRRKFRLCFKFHQLSHADKIPDFLPDR